MNLIKNDFDASSKREREREREREWIWYNMMKELSMIIGEKVFIYIAPIIIDCVTQTPNKRKSKLTSLLIDEIWATC